MHIMPYYMYMYILPLPINTESLHRVSVRLSLTSFEYVLSTFGNRVYIVLNLRISIYVFEFKFYVLCMYFFFHFVQHINPSYMVWPIPFLIMYSLLLKDLSFNFYFSYYLPHNIFATLKGSQF